jgi:poly(A) polymerase
MQPQKISHKELLKNLPAEVKKLFQIFGDDIRLVGGSVRDLLLKRTVGDFDFATRILPDVTIKILQKNNIHAIPTGIKYGTVTAVINGNNFEITTLRKDENQQGRHTDVEFVEDFYLDASRRDFTINALYLDSAGTIYDYFDGIYDLQKQEVKFIGDATQRITEDFLRILRFFRFSCEYGAELDVEGLKACLNQKENLKKLSRERIRQEFLKMLSATKRENLFRIFQQIKDQKIAAELFSSDLDIEALKQVFEIEKKPSQKLKFAVLFLTKKTNPEIFFSEICATNDEKKFFRFLISNSQSLDLEALKQLLAFYEKELVVELYIFSLSKKLNSESNYLEFLQKFSLPKFPLVARDLMVLGLKDKEIGDAISQAKKLWAKSDFVADKDSLLKHFN